MASATSDAALKAQQGMLGSESKMTDAERFALCDFTKRDEILKLFPVYMQEAFEIRRTNRKNVTKAVNIEAYTMKTPYGDQTLLKSTPLVLEQNKRQCLFGVNACGKTLLFTYIAQHKIPDFPKHIHVHHCKELETHELHDTVIGTVVNSHPYRNILVKCEAKLRELLAADPAPTGDVKVALQDNLDFVKQQMTSIKGYDAEERAAKMLRVLGFDDIGQQKLCSALSGGLRMRVALCMAFFIEADLLLLDEPTNHLDFPSVLWLENRLRGYKGSFLVVSHDRELLNNVCTAVLLIEDKQIKYYNMSFKEFEVKKAADDKKKADDIEKFLQRNLNADPATALGREKHDKKEWMEAYYRKQIALAGKFTFPEAKALENKEVDAEGKPVAAEDISLINLQNVRFSYDVKTGHFIFNDPISFNVTATTRVGVMGPNGAGKSTFLKLLTHKLTPTDGSVVHHPNFTLCYFGQHSTAELNLEMTASEFMQSQFPEENNGKLRAHLQKTGISGPVADTRMKSLSFSQRSCIIFSKLTYICPHLLIMDEPTNFLDLESVDSLIGACNKYKGALLLVSHNRDFLRKCAKAYLSIVPGHFKVYPTLKTAENATYTFIAEMEEGGKVGKDALVNNPGGGTVHASQKVGDAANASAASANNSNTKVEMVGGMKVLSFGAPPPKPVAKPAAPKPVEAEPEAAPKKAEADDKKVKPSAETYEAGEKCQALWSDGKYYAAVVKRVVGGDYQITYTQYGNTVMLPPSSLRKAGVVVPSGDAAPAKKGGDNHHGKGKQQQGGQQQKQGKAVKH